MPAELAVGSKAPAFKLPRNGGGSVSLADFKGRNLVIYFYPKADTPGCTREAARPEPTLTAQCPPSRAIGVNTDRQMPRSGAT